MKRYLALLLLVALSVCSLCSCSNNGDKGKKDKVLEKKPSLDTSNYTNFNLEDSTLIKDYKVALLSQTEKKDNISTSATTGLQRLKDRLECEIVFEEYNVDNFDEKVKNLISDNCKMIWVLGEKAADINTIAQEYKDTNFAVVNEYYDYIEDNVILINIKMAEASFLLGYVAGLATETNVVGIEYIENETSNEYLYGYKAGVEYAAREKDKQISVELLKIDDASNLDAVKTKTAELFNKNCDVIYVANSMLDISVAETTINTDKKIIALNESSGSIFVNNILTYPLMYVDSAVELVSFYAMSGNDIEGVAYEYGISEGALDIADNYDNFSSVIDSQISSLKEVVIGGAFTIPSDEASYQEYQESFQ